MSNQKDREKRREERLAAEAKASSSDQRTRILQIGAGAVFLAIVVVVVLIVANSGGGGSGGGDASKIVEIPQVDSLVNDIPQSKLVLGKASAPVELIEYGDLQCPVCKEYSEEFLPGMIEKQVKAGKAKIVFRNFTIISEESIPAGAAVIAAGAQGKGWTFLELWYRNQGEERSGYVTDEFMEAIAKAAGVKDMARFNKERNSKKVLEEVARTTEQAKTTFGFSGTPSFVIKGPKTNGLELIQPESEGDFEEAVESAS